MNRKKPKSVNCHENHQKMILSRNRIVVGENGFFGKLFHRFFGSFWWKFVTFWMWKILSTPVKKGPDKDWLFRPIPQKAEAPSLKTRGLLLFVVFHQLIMPKTRWFWWKFVTVLNHFPPSGIPSNGVLPSVMMTLVLLLCYSDLNASIWLFFRMSFVSDLVNISLLSLPNFRLTPVCPGLTMVQACSIRAVTKKKELILRSLFDIIANYLIYSK